MHPRKDAGMFADPTQDTPLKSKIATQNLAMFDRISKPSFLVSMLVFRGCKFSHFFCGGGRFFLFWPISFGGEK